MLQTHQIVNHNPCQKVLPETISKLKMEHLTLAQEDQELGRHFFEMYRSKEGSKHMAGELALCYLSAVLRTYKPEVVLEMGAGIGTQTDLLLSHPQKIKRLYTTEDNHFCQCQLSKNLRHHNSDRYTIIRSQEGMSVVPLKIDLLVGDGGWGEEQATTESEIKRIDKGSVVFAEGVRSSFRRQIEEHLKTRGLSIEFQEYGAIYKTKLLMSRRFFVPLPRTIRRVREKKGCWVGVVT